MRSWNGLPLRLSIAMSSLSSATSPVWSLSSATGRPREAPRCALGPRRAEEVERAGGIRVLGRGGPALEDQARLVGVALAVPGHRRVAAGLPVLARQATEGRAAREAEGQRRVRPRPAAVGRVARVARAVAAPVVVLGGDQMRWIVRVLRDGGLVLSLAAARQIGVGEVLAVLVDADVGAPVRRAAGVGRGAAGLRLRTQRRRRGCRSLVERTQKRAGREALLQGREDRPARRLRGTVTSAEPGRGSDRAHCAQRDRCENPSPHVSSSEGVVARVICPHARWG